jgi:hypothetical protein
VSGDPFNPVPAVRQADGLHELLACASAEHEAGQRAERASLEHYRKAGEALLRAKAAAGHGNWLPALAKTSIPQQRASEYMRLAEGWDKLPPGGSFALKEALRLIAEPPRGDGAPRGEATEAPTEAAPGAAPHPAPETELLPAAVRLLAEAGLLDASHCRQLLALRGDFTPGLLREFNSDRHPAPFDFPSSKDADGYINALRPEDMPPLWHRRLPFSTENPPAVLESCKVFDACVVAQGFKLPQWEVAAFWWACQVASVPLASEELARYLIRWRERLESELLYWLVYKDDAAGEKDRHAQFWWGVYADLRHAGALDLPEMLAEADPDGLSRMRPRDSWIYPTSLQWHIAHGMPDPYAPADTA